MSVREIDLRWRIRAMTWIFVAGLVFSGATAIPLETELDLMARVFGTASTGVLGEWFKRIRDAIHQTNAVYPFMSYGTDWLAFAHFVIAVAFIGPLRNPVRNVWVYEFGMIACGLVVPFALIAGGMRGIPIFWRLIDCSFGVFGFVPLWFCWRWTKELEGEKERG